MRDPRLTWVAVRLPVLRVTVMSPLRLLLPEEERIVAIKDTLELRIERANCLRFEAGAVGSEAPVSIP